MFIFFSCVFLCFVEENFGSVGECTHKAGITNFALDEFFIICGRSRGIKLEGIFAFFSKSGVEAEEMPVTCFNSAFFFCHCVAHAAFDTVVDARCISNDEGRTVISFCFGDCFNCLCHVCALCDLCNIDVTIAHCDCCKVFLLNVFTCCCELCNCCGGSSLGGLTAGVGVNFGIENENVDVSAGCKNMIKTAETDVVCPTVAAECPNGFFSEIVFAFKDCFCFVAIASGKSFNKFSGCNSVCFAVVKGFEMGGGGAGGSW